MIKIVTAFCTVTFYQIKSQSIDFYLEEIKTQRTQIHQAWEYNLDQIIIGQNPPKFWVAVALWPNKQTSERWFNSSERKGYQTQHIEYYGDKFSYDVLHNCLTKASNSYAFATFTRFTLKSGMFDEFMEFYDGIATVENLSQLNIVQSVIMRNPENPNLLAQLTLWDSKESAQTYRNSIDRNEIVNKYFDHADISVEFEVKSTVFKI